MSVNCNKTKTQLELESKHGTVAEFSGAIINAIGEISVMEAQEAIKKYTDEWNEAGKKSNFSKK